MQLFSIATGEYEGFSFQVNPMDSSIVEFSYPSEPVKGDLTDDPHTVIAQFKRNGGFIGLVRVPQSLDYCVIRDHATGIARVEKAVVAPAQDEDGSPLKDYKSVNDDATRVALATPAKPSAKAVAP